MKYQIQFRLVGVQFKVAVQQKINLSPSIKKLKGSINLPDDFDYKKELSDTLFEKHKI